MPLRKWRQILKPYGFDVIKGKNEGKLINLVTKKHIMSLGIVDEEIKPIYAMYFRQYIDKLLKEKTNLTSLDWLIIIAK